MTRLASYQFCVASPSHEGAGHANSSHTGIPLAFSVTLTAARLATGTSKLTSTPGGVESASIASFVPFCAQQTSISRHRYIAVHPRARAAER